MTYGESGTESTKAKNEPIIRIHKADAIDASRLAIEWEDGSTDIVDLSGVQQRFPPFGPLREEAAFRALSVIDWGNAIAWECGIDYSALRLCQIADIQRAARIDFNAASFSEWQKAAGLTVSQTSKLLGMGERQIKAYRAGTSKIPYAVQLLVQRLRDEPGLLNALLPLRT